VTLLAPGCELSELGAVGEGKHLKLAVRSNGVRSGAIAFGLGGQLDRYRRQGLYDVAFRLGANRWNGTVSPQLIVRCMFETPEEYAALRARLAAEWKAGEDAWSPEARAIFAELELVDEPGGWRALVESDTFRGLLTGRVPELAQAA
jgi:hypothetical protein